jgi:hypothetical protein
MALTYRRIKRVRDSQANTVAPHHPASTPSQHPNLPSNDTVYSSPPALGLGTRADTAHYALPFGTAGGANIYSLNEGERQTITLKPQMSGGMGLAAQSEPSCYDGPSVGGQVRGRSGESVSNGGGRARAGERERPRDIPPAYDSIPADEWRQ